MCKPQYTAEFLPNKSWHIELGDVMITEDHMESLINRLNTKEFIAPEDLAHYKMMQEAWVRFAKGDVCMQQLKENCWQASINLAGPNKILISHAATALTPWEAVMALHKEMKDLVDRALEEKS